MKYLAILICALALTGCVRTRTAMLDQNTAIISGRGTAFDSAGGVIQGEFVTAAQTTLSRGYRYFVVVGGENSTTTSTAYIPGQTYSNGTVTATGNTATYSGSSYTTPGTALTFQKPRGDITIKMFREGEIDPKRQGVWDAKSVLAVNP